MINFIHSGQKWINDSDDEDKSGSGAIVVDCGNRVGNGGGSCVVLLEAGWLDAVVAVGSGMSGVGGGGGCHSIVVELLQTILKVITSILSNIKMDHKKFYLGLKVHR